MNYTEAYSFLKNHPMFDGHFDECLDIENVMVCPDTDRIEDDASLNTKPQIWLECGAWKYISWKHCYEGVHDFELDCGGDTLEEAICALAELILQRYGIY